MNITTKAEPTLRVVITDIQPGDIFSEASHYTFLRAETGTPGQLLFLHHESGKELLLDVKYVTDLLSTADQYTNQLEVGMEDKMWTEKQIADAIKKGELKDDGKVRVGDLRQKGIRSIFEDINTSEVFACMFLKQNKPLNKKRLEEMRSIQAQAAVDAIEKARNSKKGITNSTALEQIKLIQDNPVLPYEPGEERTLRGFKVQFKSRDGRYDCIDMDLKSPDNVRPVNINTLQWLVYKGTKYILEK